MGGLDCLMGIGDRDFVVALEPLAGCGIDSFDRHRNWFPRILVGKYGALDHARMCLNECCRSKRV